MRLPGDLSPVTFANVWIRGTRLGTSSDQQGRFVIRGVPPGLTVVSSQVIGHVSSQDTVVVPPGQSVTLNIILNDSRSLHRASLMKLGRWPPPLDSVLAARIRYSTEVAAFRVVVVREGSTVESLVGLPSRHAGPDILVEGPVVPCALAWRDTLLTALQAADFARPAMGAKNLCDCIPEVRVRFSGRGPGVTVTICYSCEEVGVRSEGASQAAFFGGGREGFLSFAHAVFADDAELSHAGEARRSHERIRR